MTNADDRAAPQPVESVKRKRRYAQGTVLGEFGIIPMCDQVDDAWCPECGVKLENVRPGKHQHPTCSQAVTQQSAAVVQPLTDEHKAILKECRDRAMEWTMKARIPECGVFSMIAQDLDYLCGQLGLEEQEVIND